MEKKANGKFRCVKGRRTACLWLNMFVHCLLWCAADENAWHETTIGTLCNLKRIDFRFQFEQMKFIRSTSSMSNDNKYRKTKKRLGWKWVASSSRITNRFNGATRHLKPSNWLCTWINGFIWIFAYRSMHSAHLLKCTHIQNEQKRNKWIYDHCSLV